MALPADQSVSLGRRSNASKKCHVGLRVRQTHRWLGWFVTTGAPVYAALYAYAGLRPGTVIRRRLWMFALALMGVGLVGPGIAAAQLRSKVSLRRWYLVHESPGYVLLAAIALASLAGPRARQAGPAPDTEH